MTANRIVGIGALVLGVVLYELAGESEAYLFPRGIAIAIGLLGLAIGGATFGRPRTEIGASHAKLTWLGIVPMIAVFVAYRWALEAIGFYAAAFAAFLIIVWTYAPERASARVAARRIAISAAFVGVIFAIFAVLLRVQTPRGLLF